MVLPSLVLKRLREVIERLLSDERSEAIDVDTDTLNQAHDILLTSIEVLYGSYNSHITYRVYCSFPLISMIGNNQVPV